MVNGKALGPLGGAKREDKVLQMRQLLTAHILHRQSLTDVWMILQMRAVSGTLFMGSTSAPSSAFSRVLLPAGCAQREMLHVRRQCVKETLLPCCCDVLNIACVCLVKSACPLDCHGEKEYHSCA
jgi:hypothetical protein